MEPKQGNEGKKQTNDSGSQFRRRTSSSLLDVIWLRPEPEADVRSS